MALLAMIDPPGPNTAAPEEFSPLDDILILGLFAAEVNLAVNLEQLRALGEDERLACLVERAIDAGLVPASTGRETGVEFLRRSVKVFKASAQAGRQYVPDSYSGQVTILCAAETPNGEPKPQNDGGWGRLCCRPITVHSVPGNHFTVLREPHVRRVAEVLRQILVDA